MEGKPAIKSMTGFGRKEYLSDTSRITVEMKAVNHRYLDINVKMPRKLFFLEMEIRNYLKKKISRGKVDVYISYEDLSEEASHVRVNMALASGYYKAVNELAGTLDIPETLTAYQVSRFPDVINVEDASPDQDHISQEVMEAVSGALDDFMASRTREGENLREDILSKLRIMYDNVDLVEARYPEMVANYRNRIEEKVHNLLEDTTIDETRIATEIVLYADKISVDEETVRLRSHIKAMMEELRGGGNVGRKLDFIAQEMNREANTILSKANDIKVSGHAIEFKTDIEKIREQVQNIE